MEKNRKKKKNRKLFLILLAFPQLSLWYLDRGKKKKNWFQFLLTNEIIKSKSHVTL